VEVLEKIKAKGIESKVIVLSGQEEVDISLDYIKLGIDSYIIKNKLWKDNLIEQLGKLGFSK